MFEEESAVGRSEKKREPNEEEDQVREDYAEEEKPPT